MIYTEALLVLIISLIMVIRYRLNGVFYVLTSVGYLALLLLAVRFGKVELSIGGIIAIFISYVINTVFGVLLCEKLKDQDLRNEERVRARKNAIVGFIATQLPTIAITLICCFNSQSSIFSVGMVLFWGILISMLYNILMSSLYIRILNKSNDNKNSI